MGRLGLGATCLALLVFGLAGCDPHVQRYELGGTIAVPDSVIARDVGVSAEFGGQVTWIFGDTIFVPASCDGASFHSATAAIDPPDAIIGNVEEPVDSCGAPFALFQPGPPDTGPSRTALWPEMIVPTADGATGAVFYQQVFLTPDKWITQATSVAEIEPGATTIDRTQEVVLFTEKERSYNAGGLIDGGFLYMYATELQPDFRTAYHVTRVPHELYRERAAYTFWNGSDWVGDEPSAAPLFLGGKGRAASGGLGGMTVTFNPHLDKYLMVHSQVWKNDIILRTADSPMGPWSAPARIDVPDAIDSEFGNYSAREHPEFNSEDGSQIVLTYHRKTGPFSGELRIVEVDLRYPRFAGRGLDR